MLINERNYNIIHSVNLLAEFLTRLDCARNALKV